MQALSNLKTRLTQSIAIAMVGVLIPTVARSDWYPNFAPDIMRAVTDSAINRSVLNGIVSRRSASNRNTPTQTTQPSGRTVKLSFRPNSAVSRQVQSSIVESVRQKSPSDADQIASILASGQPMKLYSQAAATYGLKPDNVADTMTAYMVMMWLVANDVRTQPSRAAVQAVRSQVASTMTENPKFRSEQTRQAIAENLIYQFVFLNASRHRSLSTGDTAQIQQLVQATHQQGLNEFGMDLRKVTLTDAGFSPRS